MKKKFLSFVLVFAVVLLGAVSLTACAGGGKKCFYTMQEAPEHCNVNLRGTNTTNDGATYAKAGEENGISVYVDDGYYSDDFKIFMNGQEVTTTNSIREESELVYNYEYSFTPTEDFDITFSGSFRKVQRVFTLKRDTEDVFDANWAPNSELYIRFAEGNVLGLSSEEKVYTEFIKTVSVQRQWQLGYGDTVEFYVYSKGYKGEPKNFITQNDGGYTLLFSDVYHEDDKFGVHYTFTQNYATSAILLGNAQFTTHVSISTSENGGHGNLKIGSDKLILDIAEDLSTLTVTIKDYNGIPSSTKATFAALKLRINEELQAADFSSDDDGVFTFDLKKPYEYYDSEVDVTRYFQLIVDLDFYKLPYFEGEQFNAIFDEP